MVARITAANGVTIGYEDAGIGEATPIASCTASDRTKRVAVAAGAFPPRAPRRRVRLSRLRGSDSAPEGTTRDDYATTILAAMTELGIARAHVCGLSLGGVVAIAMHHAWPKRIVSLILADTFAEHPDGQGIYDRSIEASNDLRALAEARVDFLLGQPADPIVRSEVVETMARIDPAAYRIGVEAVWLASQRDRVRRISVPTLILCGTEDRATPPSLSNELLQLVSGAV